MKVLTLAESPTRMQAMFFRNGRLGNIIGFVLSLAAMTLIIYGYYYKGMPLPIMLLAAGFIALFVWLSLSSLFKSFLPTNWILAFGTNALWIKYRSYLNTHLASEDPQLILLSFSKIESAAYIRRTEHTMGSGNAVRTTSYRFLDLTLRQPVGQEVKDAVKAEKKKQRWQACPLTIISPATLRIGIKGIWPGRKKLLEQLAFQGILLLPEKREVEDYTKPVADKRKMEEQILSLAEQGRKIDAIKLARVRYGMDLKEAKQFVDELSGR